MIKGMKAFRVDKNGRLRFLFHAYKGTSVVPLDQWIETSRPWVTDGQRQKKYRSAFHFLREPDRIDKFDKLTKGKYVILPVRVQGIQPKPRTSVGSWLARRIYVSSAAARKAISNKTQ
jgi:hypothetical protein